MAYIHIKFDENGVNAVTKLRLDGWRSIEIKNDQYIEVAAGNHVVEFYGVNIVYSTRCQLDENDLLEVVLMLGLDRSTSYFETCFFVVCEPQFHIRHLEANDKNRIEEILLAKQRQAQMQQDKQERKDARVMAVVQIVWALIALVIAVAACAVAVEEPVGILFAIGFFVLAGFLLTKAIKNFKK